MAYYKDFVSPEFTSHIVYDSRDNPIYVCEAQPGTPKSATLWRIKKITYDANDNPIDIQWANGSRLFLYECDEYLSYTYS